jgi:hypothetical protein
VALLRAEIAGLRDSVLALTKHPAVGVPVLEIVGMHQPERLALAGPVGHGPDQLYGVSITYRDQLSARCEVAITDPGEFLRFFEELARRKSGWQGEKKVASREAQLVITCRYDGQRYQPEVSMDVYCALDYPSFDPYFAVQLHLDVDPESLEGLAAQARAVFAEARAEPGTAADRPRD